jgi:lipopolysaccharide transport system permease protein
MVGAAPPGTEEDVLRMNMAKGIARLGILRDVFALFVRQRRLIWEMSRREITDRYAGQMLASFWAFGHSLILIAVYVFVFKYVFKIRVAGVDNLPLDYAVYLLSGLIPWMAFAESMSKCATVVPANANLVKQVVFPIEVLPVKSVAASMLTQIIGTFFLVLYVLIRNGELPATYALLPVLWVGQFLAMVGVGFLLAAFSPYFRDIKDVVQVFTTIGMYVMPIVYLPESVPGSIRPLLYLNPFSYMCWCYQDVCCFGRLMHAWALPCFLAGALLVLGLGFAVFRRLKICFGSVL